VLCLLAVQPASAHERIGSTSHSIIIVRGEVVDYYLNMSPAISKLLAQELNEDSADFRDYFASELTLRTWDSECSLDQATNAPPESNGNRIVHLAYRCPQEVRDLTVQSHLFLDFDESHTQLVRLAPPGNPRDALREAVLTASNKTFHVADVRTGGAASRDRVLAFFKLGVEHLLSGYDHILFLLTVIIAMSLLDTVKAVTAFTLAHSLTMALAFLGLVSLSSAIVEPLIALTIVYVAIENIVTPKPSKRWALTGLFGLVHGLGFVGALKTITVSRDELLLSLVSFNTGIEAGQLLVIGLAAPALYWLRRQSWNRRFCRGFSILVGALGTFWIVQRVLP
jgi:hydrogenase/urease accessory protein HupE